MKKTILLLVTVFILAIGCKEDDPIVFTGSFLSISGPSSVSVDEASGTQTLTVILSTAPSSDLTVDLVITDGSAVMGVDYSVPSSSITIPAGEFTTQFTYTIIDNEEIDGSKTFTVALPEGSGIEIGEESSASITIVDNDFFCPKNNFAGRTVTGTDLGYSSGAILIEAAESASDGCYKFLVSGGVTFLGFGATASIEVELVEDSPEGNSGIIAGGTYPILNADGSGPYSTTTLYELVISETGFFTGLPSNYNLADGTMGFDYDLLGDGASIFPGRIEYCTSAECSATGGRFEGADRGSFELE